ncbi:MAG: SGNH/GDSL hydrolase family protein [Actinomycetaceae bacterium]|nr:SGNH/GDSL hydrolase family protein [Actinomycetaceae bacterium]
MSSRKTLRVFTPLVAVFSALALGAFAVPLAQANPDTQTQPEALKIVQLGDSYSSGNGATEYYSMDCGRSNLNYGSRVADALNASSYTNVACGGGVLADLTAPKNLGWQRSVTKSYWIPRSTPDRAGAFKQRAMDANLCGTTDQPDLYYDYRVVAPAPAGNLYTATVECRLMVAPQVDALTPDTDMVFLTMGGNDINFVEITMSCPVLREAYSCQRWMNAASAKLTQLQADATTALLAIHQRAPKAQVYLLSYPHLLRQDQDYTLPEGPAGWYHVTQAMTQLQAAGDVAQGQAVQLANQALGTVDNPVFHFVDNVKAHWAKDGIEHGLDPYMAASQENSWMGPPLASGYKFLEYMHPKPEGWAATAEALLEYINNQG